MNNEDKQLQQQLDALLAGRLSTADADQLRRRLDREAAWDNQALHDLLPRTEPAPFSLRQRLRAIPAQHPRNVQPLLRWQESVSVAAVALATVLVLFRAGDTSPSEEEIIQARSELLVAFTYLEQIGERTGILINKEIGDTMADSLLKGVKIGMDHQPNNG